MLQNQEDDKSLGSLPAYWPAWRISVHGISTDSDSEASSSPPPSLHSQRSSDSSASEDMAPAFNGGARQALKPYAQLLAEETAAMQNAAGPWRPRIEKSGKLKVSLPGGPFCSLMHNSWTRGHLSLTSMMVQSCSIAVTMRSMWC